MNRSEVRRRALRAALAVTFSIGAFGCGATVDRPPAEAGEADPEDPIEIPSDDAVASSGGSPSRPETPVRPVVDAGVVDATTPERDARADAGPYCTLGATREEQKAYYECCDANGWDFDLGCMAWGPPVPPAMRAA